MNQYFIKQLKTPTCFGSYGIHPQGVLKRASLKLFVMFCVRSRCLAACNFDCNMKQCQLYSFCYDFFHRIVKQ